MNSPFDISINDNKSKTLVETLSYTQVLLKFPCSDDAEDCYPYKIDFYPGKYKIELYGASGGYEDPQFGGKGAYTKGLITFSTKTTMYFYIGQQGNINEKPSYNGGGKGTKNAEYSGGSGGGATDMRYKSGLWSDFDSLKSRIMVASGGAGSQNHYDSFIQGAHGGSLQGIDGDSGLRPGYTNTSVLDMAIGAQQTSGGIAGRGHDSSGMWIDSIGQNGTFGKGGNASNLYWTTGGSGGYYGGASSALVAYRVGTGSSGSSFISGHPGCNAISNTYSENNPVHSGQPDHYSGHKFEDTIMKSGIEQFPSPQNELNFEEGHIGHGVVKITFFEM